MESKRGKNFKVKSIHKLARNSRVVDINTDSYSRITGIYYRGGGFINCRMIEMCGKVFVCEYDKRFRHGYLPLVDYAYDISDWVWLENWVTEV